MKNDNSIAICNADKGNCTVVMDKCKYDEKMLALLYDKNIYEKVKHKNCMMKVRDELNTFVLKL